VAAFTHDHRVWFRLWLPPGETTPSRDTYLRRVQTLDPETAVKAAFDDAASGAFAPAVQDRCETVERTGGRHERRTGTVLGGPGLCEWVADPEVWPGLRSLIRVQAERTGPAAAGSAPCATTSRPTGGRAGPAGPRPRPLGVENGLHRTLDMQFREDDGRMRTGHAPAVMGILRRAALNRLRTLQQHCSKDVSIGLLRDRIGCRPWILAAALP